MNERQQPEAFAFDGCSRGRVAVNSDIAPPIGRRERDADLRVQVSGKRPARDEKPQH